MLQIDEKVGRPHGVEPGRRDRAGLRRRAAFAVGATTFITGAVGAAGIGGGWLVDHFAAARVGVGAHACSLAGAMLLMLNPTPLSAAFALGLIGVGYGIVSGLAAGAIAQYWHKNQFGRIAGRLYIAWCAAAVGLPVLAGALFDRTWQLCLDGVGGRGDQCSGHARRQQAACAVSRAEADVFSHARRRTHG